MPICAAQVAPQGVNWTAIAAILTLVAAVVALAVPFILDWLARRSEKRASDRRLSETVSLVNAALRCFTRADEAWDNQATSVLLSEAAYAKAYAEALRTLTSGNALPEKAVVCALAAANSMDSVSAASDVAQMAKPGGDKHIIAGRELTQVARGRILEIAREFPKLRALTGVDALGKAFVDRRALP